MRNADAYIVLLLRRIDQRPARRCERKSRRRSAASIGAVGVAREFVSFAFIFRSALPASIARGRGRDDGADDGLPQTARGPWRSTASASARGRAAVRSGDPREALVAELARRGRRRGSTRPTCLSTPQILQAVYDDDWRRKQERDRQDAARLAALAMPAPRSPRWSSPRAVGRRAAAAVDDERAAARAAGLSRRSAGAARAGLRGADRLRRAAGRVLVQPLLRLGRQERDRAAPPPARSSARRSVPMCSAASPTCCARSSSIPRC